jgi:tetratricopeptide (TPR) repeat protein
MVTKEGQVKIMDFGLAKLKGATKLTKSRSTLGTAAYMSPEQASGEEVDSRSDIFSFGVVLYELLTGQLPFQGEHQAAIIYSIVNEEPQPVARFNNKVSQELERIVSKALEKEKEERYQHIDEVLADLRREKKNLEYVKTTQIPPEVVAPKPKKKLLPFLVPASIVFVLVLLFLILKPFKFQIVPEDKAVAEENSLAIMYFVNLVDPDDKDRFAQMITALLITDLSSSQYMRVVSQQRLYDILKLLGKENLKVIDKTVASEVARKAGVKWILTGNILQAKPNIVLTSDISEVTSGEILATQRVTGETGEDLFSVVDKLSAKIKENLSLPEDAKKELDRPVADVTTHSPEAYRYYLEGEDYFYKLYWTEAAESYRKALEFDSTFAMAYARLSRVGDATEEKRMIAKAVQYSDKASQKEKHYIKTREAQLSGNYDLAIEELQKLIERYPQEKEAFLVQGVIYWGPLGQPEEAVRELTKAIEIDPLYKIAYNLLAYAYNDIGNFEKSIWAINKYISLAPDEANPYDSRGEIYAFNGKIEQAIESFREAEKRKPGFSLNNLGDMYLFKREYARAESCYKAIASDSDKYWRSLGRTRLAFVPLYQGKFEQALEVLDDGLTADRMEEVKARQLDKHFKKATIFREKNDLGLAIEETEKAMEISRAVYPDAPAFHWQYYVRLLAENKEIAKAEEAALAFKREIEEKDQSLMYCYWYALGFIEWSKGNFEFSLNEFEKLAQATPDFWAHFTLAEAYLKSDRLGEAVTQFEKVLSRYDYSRAFNGIRAVKAYYLLGLAYEKSGWNKKAIEQYEEFLEIWKDADPEIYEVEDAKERVKKLRVESKE